MRAVTIVLALLITAAHGFHTAGGIAKSTRCLTTLQMAYVPDGMSPEQWKKLKEKEKQKKVGKFDGLAGAQFRSRSMNDYQVGREKGTLKPNMPMEFALNKLNSGAIKPIDIPYMQRPSGKPDNSDLTAKGYWKVAPRGFTGPGVTSPAKGGFKLPWEK
eukprot:CAMPEP_0171643020 /NCGR_PEP_ID=MMETSP0990-20121206/32373_1 /TAXON_ID=483369 /ORGANISM="non described non described, Strain CCMP2098" /LENGTH=158 /DNA_ID=CAMNT_0012218495 /DNA_START=14 /DNA_END=490 /DNA_ORIENTATION=-